MVDGALIDIGIYFSCPRSELNVVKWIEHHESVSDLFVNSNSFDLSACISGLLLQRVHPSPSQIWGYQYCVYQDTYTISIVSRCASLIYGWGLYPSDWVENAMHPLILRVLLTNFTTRLVMGQLKYKEQGQLVDCSQCTNTVRWLLTSDTASQAWWRV